MSSILETDVAEIKISATSANDEGGSEKNHYWIIRKIANVIVIHLLSGTISNKLWSIDAENTHKIVSGGQANVKRCFVGAINLFIVVLLA